MLAMSKWRIDRRWKGLLGNARSPLSVASFTVVSGYPGKLNPNAAALVTHFSKESGNMRQDSGYPA